MEGRVHTLQLTHQLTASSTPVVQVRRRSWNELPGRWLAASNAPRWTIIRFSWRVDMAPLGMDCKIVDTYVAPATCLPYASYHLLVMILLLAWLWWRTPLSGISYVNIQHEWKPIWPHCMRQQLPPRPDAFDHNDPCEVSSSLCRCHCPINYGG